MDQQIRYYPLGGTDVKITKSTQGVSLEIDCKRPREEGESGEQGAMQSAKLAVFAYKAALAEMALVGLVPGPYPKEAK